MKYIKFVFIVLLLGLCSFLWACEKGNGGEVDWDSKTIESVKPVTSTFSGSYEYDEFKLEMLKIHITYTDGTSRDISVTEDMLDEEDLKKLTRTGKPRIVIYYEGFELKMNVSLIDSSRLDENLNPDGAYACVIKAIRDAEKGVINFIFEPNEEYNICSLNFEYTYDNEIMQLSNGVVNPDLLGVGAVVIENGKVRFAYSEDAALDEEIVLFTVNYSGDFRTSKLAVSNDYRNVAYVVDYTTHEASLVNNVLYHASVK